MRVQIPISRSSEMIDGHPVFTWVGAHSVEIDSGGQTMGQAFDRDGNVVGEAFGDTKREVFDKLINLHPEADELRIKSVRDKLSAKEAITAQSPDPFFDPLMQFFAYEHLPERLQTASQPFCALAVRIVTTLPRNPERTVALRKLLEAKDCAVRALLYVS